MFKPQYLADSRHQFQPSARRCAIGRTWLNITGRPCKRYSVAEKVAIGFRIDHKNAITRILQVRA
jgi:hypothetical protein